MILAVILGVLLLAAGIFFSFTPVGYRMTVPYRHFTEIQENVYIDNSYRGDRETAMETVNAAADRVSAFWGNRESRPIIIISDDEKPSPSSAEITIHQRWFSYGRIPMSFSPTDICRSMCWRMNGRTPNCTHGCTKENCLRRWFPPGSTRAWPRKTTTASSTAKKRGHRPPTTAGSTEDRRLRYILSKHEVRSWIDEHGLDELLDLIDRVNRGEDFYALYSRAA